MKKSELEKEYKGENDFWHITNKLNIESIAKHGLVPHDGIRNGESKSIEDPVPRVFFSQGLKGVLAQANNTASVINSIIEKIERTNFVNDEKDIKKEMKVFMNGSTNDKIEKDDENGGFIDIVDFIKEGLFKNGIDENLTKQDLEKIMYDIVKTMWENDIILKANLEEGIDYSWSDFNYNAKGEKVPMTKKNMHAFEGHTITSNKIEIITDKNKNPRTAWDVFKEMAISYKKEHPEKEYLPVDEWTSKTGEFNHETDYLSMFIEMEKDEIEKTDDEVRINEYGEIIRPNNTRCFTSSEIGKATINVPTKAKQDAAKVEAENMNTKDKVNEGESLDGN